MRVEIKNWDNYNPRKDLKHVPWIRVEANLATSRKLFGLTPEEKWLWIYLLTLAAQQNNGGVIEADLDYVSHFSGLTKVGVTKAIARLTIGDLLVSEQIRSDPSGRLEAEIKDPIGFVPNERNERNERNGSSVRSRPDPTDADRLAAAKWAAFAKEASKSAKPDEAKWAEAIFELRRKANLSDADVLETLAWVQKDEFWRPNALSPAGLLKTSKSNGLRKIDNIRAKMAETKPVAPRSMREAFGLVPKESGNGN